MKFENTFDGFIAEKDLSGNRQIRFEYNAETKTIHAASIYVKEFVSDRTFPSVSYEDLVSTLADAYPDVLTAEEQKAFITAVLLADKKVVDEGLQEATQRSVDFEEAIRKLPESLQQAVLGNAMGSHAARLAQQGEGQGQGAAPSV